MEENNEVTKNNSSMAIAALVLGIISIVTSSFWYMSIPTGILAIVFGAKATRKLGSKLAKAGLITGIVGLSLCVFVYISLTLLYILTYIY